MEFFIDSSLYRWCSGDASPRLLVISHMTKILNLAKNSDGSLKWPTILSGDFDSISMETKELFTSHSAVIETPDQDKTDLTKCLEIVAQREEVLKKEVCDNLEKST
jgi:hypothetical protein